MLAPVASMLQTMSRAYQDICEGEDPWVALGDFTNDFLYYNIQQREVLISDPLPKSDEISAEYQQWAVFCAASVEYLCHTYTLPTPKWVEDFAPLTDPWFFSPAAYIDENVRAHYAQTTPIEFRKRNIYCGDKVYVDKRKAAAEFRNKLKRIA